MIEIVNLTKSFRVGLDRHLVFDNVSYHFERGVNVGVLGLNGSGKSTLLKLISGELFPDRGRVIRRGRISWPLGFAGGFHSSLSGRENLRFACRIYNVDIRQVTEFVEEFSGLGPFMDKPIKTYSTGMRAKLAFGLSIAIDFECYLIDEITAVGDFSFRQRCQAAFRKRQERASLVVVSHNPNTIRALCQKAVIIKDRKLVPFDDVEAAIAEYQSSVRKPASVVPPPAGRPFTPRFQVPLEE